MKKTLELPNGNEVVDGQYVLVYRDLGDPKLNILKDIFLVHLDDYPKVESVYLSKQERRYKKVRYNENISLTKDLLSKKTSTPSISSKDAKRIENKLKESYPDEEYGFEIGGKFKIFMVKLFQRWLGE